MGREVKRVAYDFDWPMDKVWKGFLNPHYVHYRECPFCKRTGYNVKTKQIADAFYNFEGTRDRGWHNDITQDEIDALVEAGRLKDFTHDFIPREGWKPKDPVPTVTPEEVNAWNRKGGLLQGHDAINRSILIEARAKRLGVYGECEHCDGTGELWRTPEDKQASEDWESEGPPKGDGYQIWETVSEGSPITPVFKTPEELAQWCVGAYGKAWFRYEESYESWLSFITGPGWRPTFVMVQKKEG